MGQSNNLFSFSIDALPAVGAGTRNERGDTTDADPLKLREFQAQSALRSTPRQAEALTAEVRRFCRHAEIFQHGGPEALTREAIVEYLAARRAAGIGAKTLRNVVSALTVFCRHLCDRGLLPANPCQRITLRKPDKPPPAVLTEEQLDKVMEAARAAGIWPQVALAVATGCRLSELRRLQWADVDLPGRRLIVRVSKSGRWRAVPLSELALEALAQQAQQLSSQEPVAGSQEQPGDGKSQSPPATGYGLPATPFRHVFPVNKAHRGQPPRWVDEPASAWTWCQRMRPVMQAAGATLVLGKRAVGRGYHALRHTWATRLAAANVNLEKIASWIGHTDIRMTRVYVHLGQGYDPDIETAAPRRPPEGEDRHDRVRVQALRGGDGEPGVDGREDGDLPRLQPEEESA